MTKIRSITVPNNPVIARTNHEYPPIPDRSMDWAAVLDDYEEGDYIGRGPDEGAALGDLMRQFLDDVPRLDAEQVNAIEAFHVHAMQEDLAKIKADKSISASANGYEAGFKAAMASILDALE